MDLLQLEHFLAVVDEGTFTRAAERVCRTQPAVSQSIKKLEEEIGGQLAQELRDRVLVQIPVAELQMPRRTLMICREHGYLSDSARELIKVVRSFNWDAKVTPLRQAAKRRA
jgi:Bacterial regulatory helix-turn-helix protein, lysR family